ncbi:hypothetical protein VVR12_00980 [Rothia sp. LK2588]|uniref:hypothetical protein n=1 Tax=Rothia sp. LK2588 TaxID=3114369 RepID=UPI0034CDF8B7
MGANSLRATPWDDMLRSMRRGFAVVFCGGLGLSMILGQFPAAAGFVFGSLLVYLWFFIDIIVARAAEKRSLSSVARAMLSVYVVKAMVGAAVLAFFDLPQWLSPGFVLAGAILGVIASLASMMKSVMSMRILYFDTHDQV